MGTFHQSKFSPDKVNVNRDGPAEEDNLFRLTKSSSKESPKWSIIQLFSVRLSFCTIGYWAFVYFYLERHMAKCRCIIRSRNLPGESQRQHHVCLIFRNDSIRIIIFYSAFNQNLCFEMEQVSNTSATQNKFLDISFWSLIGLGFFSSQDVSQSQTSTVTYSCGKGSGDFSITLHLGKSMEPGELPYVHVS